MKTEIGTGQRKRFNPLNSWTGALLLPLGYGLFWLAGRHPGMVEYNYSERVFPFLVRYATWPGRFLPWSLGEILLLLILAGMLFSLANLLWAGINGAPNFTSLLWRRVGGFLGGLGNLYVSFLVLWGLNYLRPPIARTLDWPTEKPTAIELQALCEDLAVETNLLRRSLPSDEQGVSWVDRETVLNLRNEGYQRLNGALAPVIPVLLPITSRPKSALFSALMSRSLTYGMYIPWTGEAILNRDLPAPALAFSVCHEMAHQQGIAREDEANFVSYLACRLHPDPLFRYSGARAALQESMAQLGAANPVAWKAIRATLEPGVLADEAAESAWAEQHRSHFSAVQGRVYDGYLKAQGQADGARSYGRVVDLLIAERRMKKR